MIVIFFLLLGGIVMFIFLRPLHNSRAELNLSVHVLEREKANE